MTDIEKMVAQLDELISDYQEMIGTRTDGVLSSDRAKLLVSRLESAIDRLAVPGSSYTTQLDVHRGQKRASLKIREIYGIALGLRHDLASGWVETVVEMVHADTHNDYLEMAETLLRSGYKDAAAVIAGTALEVHIRALCVKHGIETESGDGAPKKAMTMNTDLKKADVYATLQEKQVTAWMDLRNQAAHGNYEKYDISEVKALANGVRDFMLKYPA
ncbi:HEPN domain-containing protein [Streptomyces aurantiacus]|uniref:hypothetical protein n=1 Tax=Streptomyces aurantiacus TaxID=47760 RepID=UPI00278DC904|nr:hypothetical protein [Streptomyces aurantiacus]MDQ0776334.1 HEPN domain-containing protein [Streptomyces aurantiacus]